MSSSYHEINNYAHTAPPYIHAWGAFGSKAVGGGAIGEGHRPCGAGCDELVDLTRRGAL